MATVKNFDFAASEIVRLGTENACLRAEVERLRALALKFIDEQTEGNENELRRAVGRQFDHALNGLYAKR